MPEFSKRLMVFSEKKKRALPKKKMSESKRIRLFNTELDRIPSDCLIQIFLFIERKDLIKNVAIACKLFRYLVNTQTFFSQFFDVVPKQNITLSKENLTDREESHIQNITFISKILCFLPWVTNKIWRDVIFKQELYREIVGALSEVELKMIQTIDEPKPHIESAKLTSWFSAFYNHKVIPGSHKYCDELKYYISRWINEIMLERLKYVRVDQIWKKKWKRWFEIFMFREYPNTFLELRGMKEEFCNLIDESVAIKD